MAFWPRICKLQLDSPSSAPAVMWQIFPVSLQIFKGWSLPSSHLHPNLCYFFFNNLNFKRNKHLLSTNCVSPLHYSKSQKLVLLSGFISLDATIAQTASHLILSP